MSAKPKRALRLSGVVEELYDRRGQPYLGMMMREPFLGQIAHRLLRSWEGLDAHRFLTRRRERNGQQHHITLVAPPEMTKVIRSRRVVGRQLSFAVQGAGCVKAPDGKSYFLLLDAPCADQLRSLLGLPNKDFHLTLGFSPQDIHTMRKNRSTRILDAQGVEALKNAPMRRFVTRQRRCIVDKR
ncbi:MAG: hypothetical protein AAF788_02425 [Pseudomonadota bacterium]